MRSRHGSALLVVLGMLSFMVISGLAFSVFMRTSRLSSSFTRRTVTTRQLAKAALAEAIDQIDRAVANDPHPGVRNPYRPYDSMTKKKKSSSGSSSTTETAANFDPDKIENAWSHRVLIGQVGELNNLDSDVRVQINSTTYYPTFAEPEDTTSVLTLEALAYLPPSLINEVRYYGQRTPTAQWQSLDFDAGRFAYIAVDVSDFCDVNAFQPDRARSSDPATRVTLGHVFEDADHTQAPDVGNWTTLMDLFRTSNDGEITFGSKVPCVSLADLNLAMGTTKFGRQQWSSPFVAYVTSNGRPNNGNDGFYGNEDALEKCSLLNFVTDSLMATRPERESDGDYDLAADADPDVAQKGFFGKKGFFAQAQESRPLISIGGMTQEPFKSLVNEGGVPGVTMFAMNDYLDCDRIPITLGMPSVERVPMICGIKPALNGSASLAVELVYNRDSDGKDPAASESGTSRTCTRQVSWHLKETELAGAFRACFLQAIVAYPFRNHEQQDEKNWFRLDGKMQLFLSVADEAVPLRTGNTDDWLHWGANGDTPKGANAGLKGNAIVNLPLEAQNIDLTTFKVEDQTVGQLNQCAHMVQFDFDSLNVNPGDEIEKELKETKGDLLTVTFEWDEEREEKEEGVFTPWHVKGDEKTLHPAENTLPDSSYVRIKDPRTGLLPLGANGGSVASAFTAEKLKEITAGFSVDLQLNLAVTLRVISDREEIRGESASGLKTVDMVPATIYDDNRVNGINNEDGGEVYEVMSGRPTPLMKFELGTIKLELKEPAASPIAVSPAAVLIDDPRYNHAPENWIVRDFSNAGDWYDNLAKASAQARDGDIFMATSDQDYLQSVYEFAHLPRCSDLPGRDSLLGDLDSYDGTSWTRLGEKTPPDANRMWRTYDVINDDLEGLGLVYDGGHGPRVNPYSNFQNVLMAAFANTPHDWRVASNNADENPAAEDNTMDDAAAFNQKHAWNQYSQNGGTAARIAWAKYEEIAAEFSDRVTDAFLPAGKGLEANDDFCLKGLDGDYRSALFGRKGAYDTFFSNAMATDQEAKFTENGTDCSEVYSVDKKFLYGYWKSCFAARQQLYLVFFRAEPMMLGGGMAGVTPPQLGAKGVALVWRDPYDPYERKNSSGTVARSYPNSSSSGSNSQYIPHKTRVLFYKQFE